jgi:hypothetical protein
LRLVAVYGVSRCSASQNRWRKWQSALLVTVLLREPVSERKRQRKQYIAITACGFGSSNGSSNRTGFAAVGFQPVKQAGDKLLAASDFHRAIALINA